MIRTLILASLLSTTIACTSNDTVDELAGETAADDAAATGGKADAVDGSYTYFSITRDMRRCAAPACGGYFVSRLNRTTTVCSDNTSKASCYTPVLDWHESDLDLDTQDLLVGAATRTAANTSGVHSIVRGRLLKTRFVVTEAWVSDGTGVADGVFARIKDAGIRCIAAPCPSLKELGLNTSRSAMIAAVDYTDAGLTDTQIEDLGNALFEPSGIIVAGDRYTVTENGRTAKGRTATQAYHRLGNTGAAN